MIWKTRISEMMDTKYPIIMGAFVGLGKAEFAAAFSNAGGFGILAAINFKNIEDFQSEIDKMKRLTNKPWGVNFSIMPPYLIEKMGGKGRSEESYLDFVDLAIDAGVNVCTTSAYQAPKIGKKLHDADCYWFHKCATIKHAISAERQGADAVTIVGVEGTGFNNPLQNTTLINITMAKKLLKIPIIAAGGLGDARGFLGALAMGAEAVCFGTVILATIESPASESWKERLITQNIFDEKFHKKIFHFELKDSVVGSMAIGHIDKIVSVKEFIEKIITDTEKILRSWGFDSNEFTTL